MGKTMEQKIFDQYLEWRKTDTATEPEKIFDAGFWAAIAWIEVVFGLQLFG